VRKLILVLLFACGCDFSRDEPLLDYSSLPDPDCKTDGEACDVSGFCRLIEGAPLFCDALTSQSDEPTTLGVELSEEQIMACHQKSKLDSCKWEGVCRLIVDEGELQCSF
jgi:hypothetical protein